jgi:POT family proton-dependent oligopeptide transporter
LHLGPVFWVCNAVFFIDGAAYFGILNILTLFLNQTLRISDHSAGLYVAYMTGALTLFAALLGGIIDFFGVRRTILYSLLCALAGRLLLAAATAVSAPVGSLLPPPSHVFSLVALTLIALAEGTLQSACYAGVKKSTTEETSALGFSLLYSLLNGGIVAVSLFSSLVRERFGPEGVILMCSGITAAGVALHALFFPRNSPRSLEGEVAARRPPRKGPSGWRTHALANPRFLFFIFVLLGVRTLFAHQWLTMPSYVIRAFPEKVGARFEWISGLNPLIIVFGTPLVAQLTRKIHVVTMMIWGTLVSALATGLLVAGPHTSTLVLYMVVFSIGEALWSSRFYEFVAESAPAESVGAYMGVAMVPWFVAKTTTGLYSGAILERFCPASGPQRTGLMWLIYGLIGLTSPVGLFLARKWLRAGSLSSVERAAASGT